jgi:heptosyltransferase III
MKRFLVYRSDALGDLLLTLPVCAFIKRVEPLAHITLVVDGKYKDLLSYSEKNENPACFDDLYSFNEEKALARLSFDDAYYFGGAWQPFSKLRAIRKSGLKAKWWSFFTLPRGLRQKRSLALQHEVIANFDIISYDQGLPQHLSKECFLFYQKNLHMIYPWFQKNKNLSSFQKAPVVMHIGMKGHSLNWPVSQYYQLAKKLIAHGEKIMLTMTAVDLPYVERFQEYWNQDENPPSKNDMLFWRGEEHSWRELVELFQEARCYIGGSTGTTHLAASTGAHVISFYSPLAAQSALRWGPFGDAEKIKVFTPTGPLLDHRKKSDCAEAKEQMAKISLAEVWQAYLQLTDDQTKTKGS